MDLILTSCIISASVGLSFPGLDLQMNEMTILYLKLKDIFYDSIISLEEVYEVLN